ncbi:hypothetical protein TanjilG_27235 [Lupinus angustifolius]|uniref:Ty3-gypsy retrotransposon protein n=1 Tax=Lupinus angustifolius TaxID=3871 RepID=A0A394D9I2_LUPAN|nr:hypothetical protein TanjilG_27235 [Lupinus angustifolius]
MVVNRRTQSGYSRSFGSTRTNSYSKVVTLEPSTTNSYRKEGSSIGSVVAPLKNNHDMGSSKIGGDYRRLTSAKMKEKREKGLCFRCDEPFSRDHRCRNKQLHMLLMADEEEAEEEEVEEGNEAGIEVQAFNSLQLSLYSMKGLTSSRSWEIGETLREKPVVVIIECGASHNFISRDLVDDLQLKVEGTITYVVELGDGHHI